MCEGKGRYGGGATVVADALDADPVFTERVGDFAFDSAGDGDAAEGAVDVLHAGEGAAAAFGEEFCGVGCGCCDQVGEGGEGFVGFAGGGAGGVGWLVYGGKEGWGTGKRSRGWDGAGRVLVYGAEKEDFRFGRHWWRVLRFGCGGSRKRRIEKLEEQSRKWVDGRRVKEKLWN